MRKNVVGALVVMLVAGRGGNVGRRSFLGLLAASLALAPVAITAPASSSQELTPVPVKTADRPILESSAAADGKWFGWARYDRSRRSLNYFVQTGTTPRIRVNAKGTWAGGGGIYRHTLVYEQRRRGDSSDLYRFNLRTGRRAPFPDLVSRRHESTPTLSGRYLLFGRSGPKKRSETYVTKVMLYDRTTRTLRVLAKTETAETNQCPPYVSAGQVNGVHAVWEDGYDCYPPKVANVVLYNIRRDTRTLLPRPGDGDTSQHSSAVSSDGTVYFVREREPELTQQIVKQPIGAQAEVLYTVPSNQFASDLYVDDRARARHVYSLAGTVTKTPTSTS